MLNKIVLLATEGVTPFEFGVICEVFGIDRSESGGPRFDFTIATPTPGPVTTSLGFELTITNDLSVAADADLVAITARSPSGTTHPEILRVLADAEKRGAWILSVCSGAFTLAEAGILDGRRATTHWMYSDTLAAEYPLVDVDADVLFVDDRNVITSAGTAAGIDACLHLVRRELGAGMANIIARRMVVPPQRSGGQSQYINTPLAPVEADSFAAVTEWMLDNLAENLRIDQLAHRALMSPRTFARRFRADLGTTPASWLNRQRLIRAQQLLEETTTGLEQVAALTGFGSAAVMRNHFVRVLDTTPAAYRRTFSYRGVS